MILNKLKNIRNFLHAKACYHLCVTPIHIPLEKKYRSVARLAIEYLEKERTEVMQFNSPKHHVIHRFAQKDPNAKKILLLHGWMSRAAYMARLINSLHLEGYDIYAIDFPAHGESKGVQLPIYDAASVIIDILDTKGPFYAVIGHSFGGSVILTTLNFAYKYPEWSIKNLPEKVALLASPTRLRTPLIPIARKFKLNAKSYMKFRQIFLSNTVIDFKEVGFRHYINNSNIPILCVHGEEDFVVPSTDSVTLCQQYPFGLLAIFPGIDHVNILFDERVAQRLIHFLS